MNIKKPSFLQRYFWDVEWAEFNPQVHARFTIERILELGNRQAMHWLQKQFSVEDITQVLQQSRRLSKKSANYWALMYNIDKSKVPCLREQFQQQQKTAWNS